MGRWYKEGIPKEAGSPDDMVDGFVTRDPALWSDDEKPPEINVFNYFKLDLGMCHVSRSIICSIRNLPRPATSSTVCSTMERIWCQARPDSQPWTFWTLPTGQQPAKEYRWTLTALT